MVLNPQDLYTRIGAQRQLNIGMTNRLQRLGELNSGGGAIQTIPGQGNVFANGQLVAIQGSTGSSHAECFSSPPIIIHCAGVWQTTSLTPTVFVNNIPVTTENSVDTCGHIRIGGSLDIFVG